MYSEPFFVQLSSNPWYLLPFFILLLMLFHLIFVVLLPLSDKTWKKVEYIWFGAAALGLLGASMQAGRFVGSNYLKNSSADTILISVYADLRENLKWGIDGGVCTTFQRPSQSDKYIDEVVAVHDRLCEDYKVLYARLPETLPSDAPSLKQLGFVMPQGEGRIVGAQLRHLEWLSTRYEEIRSAHVRWRSSIEIGEFEATLTVLGPLLIAFALALRITKVTGDIVNDRKKVPSERNQQTAGIEISEEQRNGVEQTVLADRLRSG